MAFVASQFLDLAEKLGSVKKTETILPIAMKQALTTPLVVGDDLSIRTSMTSPISYDRDLTKLLHSHTELVEPDGNKQLKYNVFCSEISSIDKQSLIWALYKSTYDHLAKDRELQCPKKGCEKKFKVEILLDDLIHDDTYTIWDERDSEGNIIPFNKFRFPIHVKTPQGTYSFNTRLPTIQDNNNMLGLLSIEILQHNLESINTVFTKSQQMVLLTETMHITSPDPNQPPAQSSDPQEILMVLDRNIQFTIAEEFLKKYSEKFDKYMPKFYKICKCPECGHTFNHKIDLEVEFYLRNAYGREI